MNRSPLRLPAIEFQQGSNRVLYQFSIDGKLLPLITTVSRVRRDEELQVQGYQRPEAQAHVNAIRKYVESESPMIPNALVVAFDSRVTFEAHSVASESPPVRFGELIVPAVADGEELPGWLVDGQQRSAAIRNAEVDHFFMPVVAFITDDDDEQREQFILVNSAKPLPKSLIYELLPSTDVLLPTALARRRLPAQVADLLNHDSESPFFSRIQTPTNPDGVIKDNSVLRMVENSISDGALYRFRNPETGDGDADRMAEYLNRYWDAVAQTFPEAWAANPRRSRLVHGVGIVAMGYLMDAIGDYLADEELPAVDHFADHLSLIEAKCRWTAGVWEFGPGEETRWNALQNTPRHIRLLANHLLALHRQRLREAPISAGGPSSE